MIATQVQLGVSWRTDLKHLIVYDVRQFYTRM
jgi:hypothetical protein